MSVPNAGTGGKNKMGFFIKEPLGWVREYPIRFEVDMTDQERQLMDMPPYWGPSPVMSVGITMDQAVEGLTELSRALNGQRISERHRWIQGRKGPSFGRAKGRAT
jgi:hypothetical protein